MGKYFLLQLKRVARFLPFGLCVALVLFGCLSLAFQAMLKAQEDPSAQSKVQVGLVGTAGDRYLQWGLAALQFDSSMLSIDIETMTEEEATAALKKGQIAAYIVFPEGFVDAAFRGDIQKLRFVSTIGAAGLVPIIKEEITGVVDNILVACQKGSYGVGEALDDQGHGHLWGQHVNDLALEYADFVFDRSRMYQVEALERFDGVPLDRSILGGLTVMLMLLACLPFAPLFIRNDHALARMLRARRISGAAQALGEFAAYFLAVAAMFAVVSLVLDRSGLFHTGGLWSFFLGGFPTLFMIAAMTYLGFCLSQHLSSGVLLCFFGILALCFVSGCIYPVRFFPESVQRLAAFLPTGLACQSLTDCFMAAAPGNTAALLMFGGLFLAVAMVLQTVRTGRVRG